MTDRIRFENNATAHNTTIIESTATTLHIVSSNGCLHTIYTFDKDGNFVDSSH